MIATSISFNHKYKLGDTVWIKAQCDTYKPCKTCKQSNHSRRIQRIVKGKVSKISLTTSLYSAPEPTVSITYHITLNQNSIATVGDWQCYSTKKEAKKANHPVSVYDLK